MNPILTIGQGILGLFAKRAERKAAETELRGKVQQIKAGTEQATALSMAEWERISKLQEDGTWKDEFITIVVSAPLLVGLCGAILDPLFATLNWSYRLLDTFERMLQIYEGVGIDYGLLLTLTVCAAIGFRAIKG